MVVKVKGLAGSRDLQVYSTPKHGPRDDDYIWQKLNQTQYAIFLAYDKMDIDGDTGRELKFLSENNKELYFLVPHELEEPLDKLGLTGNKYLYKRGDMEELKENLNKIMTELTRRQKGDDFSSFLIIMGLLLMIVLLFGATISASN